MRSKPHLDIGFYNDEWSAPRDPHSTATEFRCPTQDSVHEMDPAKVVSTRRQFRVKASMERRLRGLAEGGRVEGVVVIVEIERMDSVWGVAKICSWPAFAYAAR